MMRSTIKRIALACLFPQPPGWYSQFAANSRGSEVVDDRSAELVGDQTTNHAGPISGNRWSHHQRSACLAPLENQALMQPCIGLPMPPNRYPAATVRKSAVFGGIGG